MERTDVELEANQDCHRQHPCDRGADGDYGQHGHQRVASDEDEYKVGADLYMHMNEHTWMQDDKEEQAYVHLQMQWRAHACITSCAHGVPAR